MLLWGGTKAHMQMKAPDCGLLPQDGVCLRTLGEQRSGISTKKPRKAVGAGSKLYGRFVKVPPRDVALRAAHPLPGSFLPLWPLFSPFFPRPPFPSAGSHAHGTRRGAGQAARRLGEQRGGGGGGGEIGPLFGPEARREGWGWQGKPCCGSVSRCWG